MPDLSSIKVAASPAAYLQAAREIEASGVADQREVRVALLATVSAQVLRPFLVVEGAARGLRLRPWFAPFGQLEEQAFDDTSALYAERPDAVIVLARLEELAPEWADRFLIEPAAARQQLTTVSDRLRAVLEALRQRTSAVILVANFASTAAVGRRVR